MILRSNLETAGLLSTLRPLQSRELSDRAMPLDSINQKRLNAAQGYVELGMFIEANDQIEDIDPFCRCVPQVLATRLAIYNGTQKWELARVVAKRLTEFNSGHSQWFISLAYATRRAESIEAARTILLQALNKHPKDAIIHYNLACYECQLDDMPAARRYLKRAFEIEQTCRAMALDDPDLEPLWLAMDLI